MRTRARTLSSTVPAGRMDQYQTNPLYSPGPAVTTTAPVAYTSLQETIIDEEHVMRRRSGTVVHSKERTVICDGGATTIWSWLPQTYRSVYTGGWLYRTLVEPRLGSLPPRPTVIKQPFDWRQASYEAMKQMRPSVDEGLLMPNFAKELAESVALVSQYAKRRVKRAERDRLNAEREQKRRDREAAFLKRQGYQARRGKTPISAIVASLPSLGELLRLAPRVVERIGKAIAWVNLVYQFAIRPTIQDARKLALVIENWRKRVAELIRQAEKRQIRHYKRPVDNLFSLPQTALSSAFSFDRETAYIARLAEWVTRPEYHANMLFTYDASRLKGLFGQLDGLIHAFGVNRIASVVWEAVPFSFVVDWFVNVGDMIASVEDNLEGDSLLPCLIHDFSHSLKYEYRTRLELRWKPQGSSFNIQVDMGHYYTSSYERRRDYPSLWDSLSVRLPNLNQAGLGLSLMVVKMDGVTGKF